MNKVLKALRFMAEHREWKDGTKTLSWCLGMRCEKQINSISFTQDEIIEFMKHYDEISNKIVRFKEHSRERR